MTTTTGKDRVVLNASYQVLFYEVKSIIKEDACMKFYDEMEPPCLETYASSVGLGDALLQTIYKVQAVQEIRHLTTVFWDQSLLQVKACQLQK